MQSNHYKIIRILMSVLKVLIKQPIKLTLYKKCCVIITLIYMTTYIFIHNMIFTPPIKIYGSMSVTKPQN
jgi:hypothetical protein